MQEFIDFFQTDSSKGKKLDVELHELVRQIGEVCEQNQAPVCELVQLRKKSGQDHRKVIKLVMILVKKFPKEISVYPSESNKNKKIIMIQWRSKKVVKV